MDGRLYEAALTGSLSLLRRLLEEDPRILDVVKVGDAAKETPLHIASQFGHVEFVKEILEVRPEFTCKLNCQEQTPLHLASAEGHIEAVKALLEKDTNSCFVRDRDGRTPLHIAAIKGRTEVLKELVKAKKIATLVKTYRGEPLLHLCVNNDQFEAAKTLIEIAGDDKEFVNLKDSDDNSILHLLTAKRQYKIIKLLFPGGKSNTKLDVNAVNFNGSTALDVLQEIPGRCNRMKTAMILRGVDAKRARKLPTRTQSHFRKSSKSLVRRSSDWTGKTRDALMVVAILIATVTFQAAQNPPGGVWQSDESAHKAGQSVMSEKFPTEYLIFMISNTVGFIHSLMLILLLLCGFCFKRKFLMRALIVITWICVVSIMVTYGSSFSTLATDDRKDTLFVTGLGVLLVGWMMSIPLLFGALLLKLIKKLLQKMEIIYYICWVIIKVKNGLVWIFCFIWKKASMKDHRKMTSAAPRDTVHESLP